MKKRWIAVLSALIAGGLLTLAACSTNEPPTGENRPTEPSVSAGESSASESEAPSGQTDGNESTSAEEKTSAEEGTDEADSTNEESSTDEEDSTEEEGSAGEEGSSGEEGTSDEEGTTDEEGSSDEAQSSAGETPTGFSDADLAGVNSHLPAETARDMAGWIAEANVMFGRAAETFYREMFTSDWLELDYDEPGPSPIYTRVTNYETLDEATADFFDVFSKETFATAPYDRFVEKDGALFAAVEDREKDPSYQGYSVVAVSDITDDSISFVVTTRYAAGERSGILTLKYERGDYRVSGFTQPY